MDAEGSEKFIAIVVMILVYAALVFSKMRKAGRETNK